MVNKPKFLTVSRQGIIQFVEKLSINLDFFVEKVETLMSDTKFLGFVVIVALLIVTFLRGCNGNRNTQKTSASCR